MWVAKTGQQAPLPTSWARQVIFTALARIALRIPIRGLSVAHDFGQPCAIVARAGRWLRGEGQRRGPTDASDAPVLLHARCLPAGPGGRGCRPRRGASGLRCRGCRGGCFQRWGDEVPCGANTVRLLNAAIVRKTPSYIGPEVGRPRSWADFSPLSLCSYRNAGWPIQGCRLAHGPACTCWVTLTPLPLEANLTPFLARSARCRRTSTSGRRPGSYHRRMARRLVAAGRRAIQMPLVYFVWRIADGIY
jgi:hypothetical protein